MTDSDICRSFLTARQPGKQIRILSELTLLPQARIREILAANGIDPETPDTKKNKPYAQAAGSETVLPAAIRKEVFEYGYHRRYRRCAKRL